MSVARLAVSAHATPATGLGQQVLLRGWKSRFGAGKRKWRLLLPGASGPRLTELNPSGLQTWFFKPLTRPEQPEHSCRLQLLHSPITAEPYREKTRPLRPRRSCFAPAETRATAAGFGGGAGCCPRSEWFIATALYFHSRQTGPLNISPRNREKQSLRKAFRRKTNPRDPELSKRVALPGPAF